MTTPSSPADGSPARSRHRTKKKTPSGAAGGRSLSRSGGRVARGGGVSVPGRRWRWGRAGAGRERERRARARDTGRTRDETVAVGFARARPRVAAEAAGKEKKRREKCLKDGLVPNDNRTTDCVRRVRDISAPGPRGRRRCADPHVKPGDTCCSRGSSVHGSRRPESREMRRSGRPRARERRPNRRGRRAKKEELGFNGDGRRRREKRRLAGGGSGDGQRIFRVGQTVSLAVRRRVREVTGEEERLRGGVRSRSADSAERGSRRRNRDTVFRSARETRAQIERLGAPHARFGSFSL